MIKSYSDTDYKWDTIAAKWIKPAEKKKEIPKVNHLKVGKKPYGDMTYQELIFDIYKECRESENWHTIMILHDEEDRLFFDSLDKMTGRIT